MENPAGELIERITRLEHQQDSLNRANRRLRLTTAALMLFIGAAFLMGQTSAVPSRSIEAESFYHGPPAAPHVAGPHPGVGRHAGGGNEDGHP
jgi:hypothetical protein